MMRDEVGTKLGRSWDDVGTTLVRSWYEVGTNLGRKDEKRHNQTNKNKLKTHRNKQTFNTHTKTSQEKSENMPDTKINFVSLAKLKNSHFFLVL